LQIRTSPRTENLKRFVLSLRVWKVKTSQPKTRFLRLQVRSSPRTESLKRFGLSLRVWKVRTSLLKTRFQAYRTRLPPFLRNCKPKPGCCNKLPTILRERMDNMPRRIDDFRPYTAEEIAFLNRGVGIDVPNL